MNHHSLALNAQLDYRQVMIRLISIILCLILALQSNLYAFAESACPMDNRSTVVSDDDTEQKVADNCCNDAETAAQTGQLCKPDVPCSVSGLYFVPSLSLFVPPMKNTSQPLTYSLSPEPSFFATVWRPPQVQSPQLVAL